MDEPNYQITQPDGTVIGEIGETSGGKVAVEHAASGEQAILDQYGLQVPAVITDDLSIANSGTRVYLNTDQTIQENSITGVAFDSITFDDDDEADLSNNGITVNDAGRYLVTATIQFEDVSADSRVFHRISRASQSVVEGNLQASNSGYIASTRSTVVQASASDTFIVEVLWDSGGSGSSTLQGDEYATHLTVSRIG